MIKKAAEFISSSRKIVVITGAGISTEAGIPDFRSPETGLWNKVNPMITFSSWGFKLRPKAFYRIGLKILPSILDAKPTLAHHFLAKLEQRNCLSFVITQNIDGLHQKAGSKKVIEIHGNLRKGHCIKCNKEYTLEEINLRIENDGIPPKCERCKKPIKPNIVLFGDPLPYEDFYKAEKGLQECDLLIIIGSSLLVYPVADLPHIAVDRGVKIIIMNLERTPFDKDATLVLRNRIDETCREINEFLKDPFTPQ